MEFTNEITLGVPADEAFAALTDVERVASCLPGARIEGRDGDSYRGAMRMKIGPIQVDYRGALRFEELDAQARRAVLLASAEDAGGQGSAEARITSSVSDDGNGARVIVHTELQVAGRVAQFGSGAMSKIAKRMFADFAKNLERLIASDAEQADTDGAPPASRVAPTGSAPQTATAAASTLSSSDDGASSLNVLDLVGEPVARAVRGAVPIVITLLIGYLFGQLRARPPHDRRNR
jgi:carbon monoxide dehydrogenase subunit G